MLRVLIIEDELPNIKRLEKTLKASDAQITVAGSLQTVDASIKWLLVNPQPDVILMDIQLTDGLSFEIFDQVEIKVPVIFTTAYDEYALKAFEVNGIDYLLKPIEAEKLTRSLLKAKRLLPDNTDHGLKEFFSRMQQEQPVFRTRFLIAYCDRYLLITTTEIAYFISENKATYLNTHTGQRYLVDQSLEILEDELDPRSFFRLSRQLIVSLKSIRQIHQYFNSQLKIEIEPGMPDGVLISRDRSSQLKRWLNETDIRPGG